MNLEIFETQSDHGNTCRSCEHRQRHEKNSKVIQFCAARKSNLTDNGLLKIKASDLACPKYQQMYNYK